jgi:3-hydroxybutyryl-CoA dehydrogenase
MKTIDRLMEAGGFPMGPFRLMDFLGVDTVFEMTQAIFEATLYAASYRPNPRQQRLIEAGRLGRKSGRGFYEESS